MCILRCLVPNSTRHIPFREPHMAFCPLMPSCSSCNAGRGAAAAPRVLAGGEGILYSNRVKSIADLKSDDEAAAAEQAAQGGEYPPADGCLYEEPYHARLCAQYNPQQ